MNWEDEVVVILGRCLGLLFPWAMGSRSGSRIVRCSAWEDGSD